MNQYHGKIKYNEEAKGWGFVGVDGEWVITKLEPGDRVDLIYNGEVIPTNYEDFHGESPYLKPHGVSNWDWISSLPAVLHYSEKEKPLSPKEYRKIRWKLALFTIGVSMLCSVVLGAIFALLFNESFIDFFTVMFWFVGAGGTAGGLLMIINILPENLCIGFGCALYYGTILLSAFLSKFIYGAEVNRYVISFVIVSLICYIVWLKEFKPKDDM